MVGVTAVGGVNGDPMRQKRGASEYRLQRINGGIDVLARLIREELPPAEAKVAIQKLYEVRAIVARHPFHHITPGEIGGKCDCTA